MKFPLNSFIFFVFFTLSACTGKNVKKEVSKNADTVNNSLPYESNRNHIILNGIIEGKIKARLIYDTGAGAALYLDSAFTVKHNWFKSKDERVQHTESKGLRYYSEQRNLLQEKKIHFSLGRINDSLSGTLVANISKVIKDKADGIIGNSFMSNYIVELNYKEKTVTLHDPKKFSGHAKYLHVPIKFNQTTKLIEVKVDFLLENGEHFTRDSHLDLGVGADHIVIASNLLIRKFDLENQLKNKENGEPITTMFGSGLSTVRGNIKEVVIGDTLKIDTPKIQLTVDKRSINQNSDGWLLLGNYIFKRFGKILIDYQNNKIYIPKS